LLSANHLCALLVNCASIHAMGVGTCWKCLALRLIELSVA
jgi:hypothetical protein